jgi:hypothetical protein
MGKSVGIQHWKAQCCEVSPNTAFAGCNPAGEADASLMALPACGWAHGS